jgi:hypothetical protein
MALKIASLLHVIWSFPVGSSILLLDEEPCAQGETGHAIYALSRYIPTYAGASNIYTENISGLNLAAVICTTVQVSELLW